jgi:hypothetical protein
VASSISSFSNRDAYDHRVSPANQWADRVHESMSGDLPPLLHQFLSFKVE